MSSQDEYKSKYDSDAALFCRLEIEVSYELK